MEIITRKLADIHPYEANPRKNENAVEKVAASLQEFGWKQPIVIDKDGTIVAGHTRYKAAEHLGMEEAPCIMADDLTEEQVKAYRLADNKTSEFADWDIVNLGAELKKIEKIDMRQFGFTPNNIAGGYKETPAGALKRDFIMPPFSVLDARQGDWQKRKKAWHERMDSHKSRGDRLLGAGLAALAENMSVDGTSVFDPVLCEIIINWFSKHGGGSARSIQRGSSQRDHICISRAHLYRSRHQAGAM